MVLLFASQLAFVFFPLFCGWSLLALIWGAVSTSSSLSYGGSFPPFQVLEVFSFAWFATNKALRGFRCEKGLLVPPSREKCLALWILLFVKELWAVLARSMLLRDKVNNTLGEQQAVRRKKKLREAFSNFSFHSIGWLLFSNKFARERQQGRLEVNEKLPLFVCNKQVEPPNTRPHTLTNTNIHRAMSSSTSSGQPQAKRRKLGSKKARGSSSTVAAPTSAASASTISFLPFPMRFYDIFKK